MSKRIFCLLIVLWMLCTVLSACDSKGNEYDQLQAEIASPPSALPAETDLRTLRFGCYGYDSVTNCWINHANAYMETHAGVDIQVEILGKSFAGDDNLLSTQLMTQKAPDVLAIYPTQAILQNGHFLDLQPYVEDDPAFTEDNYFIGMIEAAQMGGNLYAIPYSFTMANVFAMRKDIDPAVAKWFESAEIVTYEDMVLLYEQVGAPNDLYFYESFTPADPIDYYLDACIDLSNHVCDFQNKALLELLDRTKTIPITELVEIKEENATVFAQKDVTEYPALTNPDAKCLFRQWDGIVDPEMFFSYAESIYTTPRAVVTAAGNHPFFLVESLAITDSCKDSELAWDFIKFCMADHVEAYDFVGETVSPGFEYISSVGGMACINRATFFAQCKQFSEDKYDLTELYYSMTPGGERGQIIQDTATILQMLPMRGDICLNVYSDISNVMWPEKYLYLSGKDTAAEMLSKISSKVNLYLNE